MEWKCFGFSEMSISGLNSPCMVGEEFEFLKHWPIIFVPKIFLGDELYIFIISYIPVICTFFRNLDSCIQLNIDDYGDWLRNKQKVFTWCHLRGGTLAPTWWSQEWALYAPASRKILRFPRLLCRLGMTFVGINGA
jgi:hypothetical protein